MAQLSDRLQRLAPSATLAMSQKSSEMKAQGIDVINMSVGEPDFNTPDHIKEAAKKAIDDNYSRYSPVPGYADLRKAIVEKLKNENGLDYTVNEVLVSNGAKQSVCNTVMALVNPGDEVIIPAPYWVSYPQMVKLAGGTPVIVEAGFEQNFKMTPEQLEAAITPKTRLLIQHHRQRSIKSIRYDRLAYRLHRRTRMDCQRLQQVARTIHQRSMLRKSESSRVRIHTKSGMRRADASGL